MKVPIKCVKCGLVEMLEVYRNEINQAGTYVCPDCALDENPEPFISEPHPFTELERILDRPT
jgi:hypothetical protein